MEELSARAAGALRPDRNPRAAGTRATQSSGLLDETSVLAKKDAASASTQAGFAHLPDRRQGTQMAAVPTEPERPSRALLEERHRRKVVFTM
jgi:hypothetical protein